MPTIEEVTEDTTVPETKEKSYDDMTPAEREIRDAELRAKEIEEQSSKRLSIFDPQTHLFHSPELPYQWKQELNELDITVPLPKGTRPKDLVVKIMKKKLSVGLKGQEPILEGELCQEIKVEESTWTIRKPLTNPFSDTIDPLIPGR